LYFSGRGLKDDSGKLYLAMKDTRLHKNLFTSVTADQVDLSLTESASRQKILVLDCCYAGAFPSGTRTKADDSVHVLETFSGRGRIVLTASMPRNSPLRATPCAAVLPSRSSPDT
jgi:hypothetical protein